VQIVKDGRVLVALRLVEVLMPTGAFGAAAPAERRTFLRDRAYTGALGLSTTAAGVTRLTLADVQQCDWLVGTVAQAYGLPAGARGRDHLAEIAVKDHVARTAAVHPSVVEVSADLRSAQVGGVAHQVQVSEEPDRVTVTG